jgi:flagella basal body P-ring formation protein FlgA
LFPGLKQRAVGNIDAGNIPSAIMKILTSAFIVFLGLLSQSTAAQTPAPRQDQSVIRQTVEQFLRIQSAGLPGQVTIKVGQIDTRLNLSACAAPEAFMPNGSRAWGRTIVGVRCSVPAPWTVYVPATVQVLADYMVTAAPLAQGQTIGPADIAKVKGDLTTLPAGIITDPAQAVGRTIAASLPPGTPLRQDTLRTQQAVQQGQMIRLVSVGPGFKVSTEARALNNATEGQVTQARTPAGQVVTGIAKAGGILEVTY